MINAVVLNDLHFGIDETKRLYNETIQIKDFIKKQEKLDLLVINGDYFDGKLALTDDASFYASLFFNELVCLVREKNIIFRVLQGTRSHDLNQLQLFKPYMSDTTINFRIIETVEEEEIKGMKVLYLPEEYPEDCQEYYSEYKKKEYNVIFLHGTFDFVAQPGVIENAMKKTHSAPVFFYKEWKDALKNGFVSAGHIHGRNVYTNKIYYSGSFSRWNFGERSEKGFTYFEFDLENNKYKVEFINNTMAPKYEVYSLKEMDVDCEKTTVEEIETLFNSIINDEDHFRLDLTGISKDKYEILKAYYLKKQNVKIEYKEVNLILTENREKVKNDFEKYHYITRRELPLSKTIQKYCKEELNVDLTLDVINKIIANKEG